MDAERWQRVSRIYEQACDCAAEERERVLADACGQDDALRREVQSLLDQDVLREDVIERVANEARAAWSHPASIGRYRIRRLIGEGGMGTVYEAEQDHPRRVVALKVLKSPLAGAEEHRRFARESEALGRLQHPGIARIYDAGTAETAWGPQPYLALEFIEGPSLTEYARAHNLGVAKRVQLMAAVCDAVDHAHRRGIVHRDLKAANILVDDRGQPKVLDFGIARMLDADDPRSTNVTRLGDVIGTLAYMSPEQMNADLTHVDARSDVYSLGVVMYELLTGRDRKSVV